MPVGVDPHRRQAGDLLLQPVHQPEDIVRAEHRLSKSTKYQFPIGGEVPAEQIGQRLLPGGLMFQPEVIGIDAALVTVVPQAEYTRAVTAIGKIHIEGALILIANGHHGLFSPFFRRPAGPYT